ncbi:hypothetical protein [Pseudoalteromonas sp. T1lg75]|uniref:hypothetical protein n=1 Tax=Pseudoalteromonas sp. T1lg75 TaxID=2077102 RepID=UPI0018FE4EF6|nr:hypothetical protein [Pseudoalteromonas sp. T1lg75]
MRQQPSQQADLFALDQQRVLYAELCNAFYARELHRISQQLTHQGDGTRLARLLDSLPYYVERAAFHIVHGHCPLTLDGQNGSWIAKQASRPPQSDKSANLAFFSAYAEVGILVPLLVTQGRLQFVVLDTLDQVSSNRLHCNQAGWFDLDGQYRDTRLSSAQDVQLLVPNKKHFTPACCGHRWQQHKVTSPRTLSLREMLLTTRINWKNFKQPLPMKES